MCVCMGPTRTAMPLSLPSSLSLLTQFFSSTSYIISGRCYSLNDLENGVLRSNRKPPANFRRPFSSSDPRSTPNSWFYRERPFSSSDPRSTPNSWFYRERPFSSSDPRSTPNSWFYRGRPFSSSDPRSTPNSWFYRERGSVIRAKIRNCY